MTILGTLRKHGDRHGDEDIIQLDLLTHLAKFQSITNIRSRFILTFISENLRPPLINLVPRLGCKWEKVT